MSKGDEKEMDYASLDVPWAGDETVQREVRLRWAATFVYIILVTVGALLPFLWTEMDEGVFVTVYMIIVMGGAILLTVILSRPLLKPHSGDVRVKDGLAIEEGVARKLRPGETYYFRTRFNLILYILVPVVVFMAVLMFFIDDLTTLLIMGPTTAGIAILALIFINFEVKADRQTLSFKFGFFGKELPLDDISAIRVTNVNALKDFMGYGVRLGPDGTIGYILRGGAGFRVETTKGKSYVVTIPEPEGLVEYVKAAKAEGSEPRR
jgi:hypothetical protein